MKEEIAYLSLLIAAVALVSAIFFGGVLASQMSIFYFELLGLPKLTETPEQMAAWNAVLNKYRWGWYFPNLVGFVFAIIAVVAGIVSYLLIPREAS